MTELPMVCTCGLEGFVGAETRRVRIFNRMGLTNPAELTTAIILSLAFDFGAEVDVAADMWFDVVVLTDCAEILTSGTVLVKRPDAAELLSIRQGAWSYERLIDWARDQDAKMAALAAASSLPHSPDREAIGTLCESLLREGLGLQGHQGVQDVN